MMADECDGTDAIQKYAQQMSAEDMTHSLVAQMSGGVYQDKLILSAEGIETLHRGAAVSSGEEFYAIGWEGGKREGLKAIFHSEDWCHH